MDLTHQIENFHICMQINTLMLSPSPHARNAERRRVRATWCLNTLKQCRQRVPFGVNILGLVSISVTEFIWRSTAQTVGVIGY